jgi:hypothetical protein
LFLYTDIKKKIKNLKIYFNIFLNKKKQFQTSIYYKNKLKEKETETLFTVFEIDR